MKLIKYIKAIKRQSQFLCRALKFDKVSFESHWVPKTAVVFTSFMMAEAGNSTAKPLPELDIPYAVVEGLLALSAVIGNAIVIYVFYSEKKLWKRTNFYIISLATADLLVGLLGIPFAIMVADSVHDFEL